MLCTQLPEVSVISTTVISSSGRMWTLVLLGEDRDRINLSLNSKTESVRTVMFTTALVSLGLNSRCSDLER